MTLTEAPGSLWLRGRHVALAVLVGVLLAAAWAALGEVFFEGTARSMWPAWAMVVPVAVLAALAIGRRRARPAAAAFGCVVLGALLAVAAWPLVLVYGVGGHCDYTPTEAAWTEPGLYAWLQVHGGTLFATWSPGVGALPFEGGLDGRPPPGPLASVTSWREGSHGLRLERDGWITAAWPADLPEDAVRATYLDFARDLTAADDAALQAAADAYLASTHDAGFSEGMPGPDGSTVERPFVGRSAPLPGPLRLAAVANETGASWATAQARPGNVVATGGDLTWEFTVPHWSVRAGEGTVTVDALDRVLVEARFAELDGDEAVARKVRAAFAEARLPPPALAGLQHSGYVC